MAAQSSIEWTDATWNPTVGCSIVSPGCTNCYAMKVAHGLERRFNSPKYFGLTKVVNGNAVWTGEVRLDETALLQPLKWKKPRRIFVNSMSDLFHESLPDEAVDKVFAVMALCPQHTFQVLTKRAERMREYCARDLRGRITTARIVNRLRGTGYGNPDRVMPWPLPNVWLGISAERQQEWDERKEHLRATPAAVRFASFEPLLGPIVEPRPMSDYLQWAIVGGESGSHARPMDSDWPRSLRDQCSAGGVPYFFKQHGEWIGVPDLRRMLGGDGPGFGIYDHCKFDCDRDAVRVGKKAAGRLLDGVEHSAFPQSLSSV